MGVVFAKTAKGQAEIATKAGGLSPRGRRVLIFVDGKRSQDALRGLLPGENLDALLATLLEAGYIAPLGADGTVAVSGGASSPPAGDERFAPLPLTADPVRLQMARNFMLNTLRAFVGAVGTSALVERIEAADDHAALRALFDEWQAAIVATRDGRRERDTLSAKLREVI